jgi:hypothetical protein
VRDQVLRGFSVNGYLYWTADDPEGDAGQGSVLRFEPATGSITTLARGRTSPGAVAGLTGLEAYWAEGALDAEGHRAGVIVRWTADGGATVFQRTDEQGIPRALNASWPMLSWTNADPAEAIPGGGAIRASSMRHAFGRVVEFADGGAATAPVPGPEADLVYYAAADGLHFGYVDDDGGVRGGTFLATAGAVHRIEWWGNDLYFVDWDRKLRAVSVVSDDPVPPVRLIASDVDPKAAFQIDSQCAYWIDANTGTIRMVKR